MPLVTSTTTAPAGAEAGLISMENLPTWSVFPVPTLPAVLSNVPSAFTANTVTSAPLSGPFAATPLMVTDPVAGGAGASPPPPQPKRVMTARDTTALVNDLIFIGHHLYMFVITR